MDAAPVEIVDVAFERASFANEPVAVLQIREMSGALRTRRIVGGPNSRGGITFVQGFTLHAIRASDAPLSPGSLDWVAGTPAGTWAALPVPIHLGLPKSRDLGDATDSELDVATRSWGRPACTSFRASYAGTTTNPPGDDGVSGVYFQDTTWPSTLPQGVIATTVIHVDAQNHIYDADIYVDGADHVFSLDGAVGTIDFRSIVTHELGHALGLGHSADPIATMYASYPPGVAWRSLEQDDRDGVCALYPGSGDLLGCEANACPSGFVCVARDCERVGDPKTVCSPCQPVAHACEGAGDTARCVEIANGWVCGRACAADADCGQNFKCQPTTQAGDLQCVTQDGCTSAANTCQKDVDCKDPDALGFLCRGGVCVGPLDDGGVDAGDAGDGGRIVTSGGGCSTAASPFEWIHSAPLLFLLRRRRAQR